MNKTLKLKKHAIAAAVALSAFVGAAPANANLLINGSFETGSLSDWSHTGNLGFTSVVSGGAQDGIYRVSEGPIGSEGLLSQTFATTASASYLLSGWVNGVASSPSHINFYWNSVSVVFIGDPVPALGWTNYTATVSGTGSDTFTVGFQNDPSFDSLDNFSVTAAIPEPETYAMLLAGLGLLGFAARRRKLKEAAAA